jgi:PAS domain S-box-containing protein
MFQSIGLPHGFCFLWNPRLLWLNIASDSLIALAYFLIPVALVSIARKRRDVPFNGVFFCFAAFIVSCGLTHVMEVVTLWFPIYWVSGALKAVTASVSVATLAVLIRITPGLLAMPHQLADQRFRGLIENAPDAILQVDAKGTIVIANRTAERIFGYRREELLGVSVEQLIPIDRRGVHRQHRADFLSADVTRPMGAGMGDLYARRKDGSEVSVEIGLSPVKTGDGLLVTAVIRDVSDRKRAEQELQRAQHALISVLESTTMSVMAISGDWKIEYMNHNAKNLLTAGKDLCGVTLWEAFPRMEEASRVNLRRVMETRLPMVYESYYDPAKLSARVKAAPWQNGGITIFFSDISDQKRLERELEWERTQRNQRIEVLARLSSELAHEIKNPLAIIHARASDLAEMISDGEAIPEGLVAETCGSIVKTSDRAIRILRGVAALAREGRNDPMEEVGISAIVDQAIALVQGRYRTDGIQLEAIVPAGLPRVECREVQIEQVLVNLLNNAHDAIEGNARSQRWVRLEVSARAPSGPKDPSPQLTIDVIDGGPGVPAELKERLMETFFTTKPAGAGIGIGLSVSRAIAEDHGGRLELRDSDGHTCFRLTLPVHAAQEQGVAA